MANLNVPFTSDFSGVGLTDITMITFASGRAPATASFAAGQFKPGVIAVDVEILGSSADNHVVVAGGSVDASHWLLTGWSEADSITLLGSDFADDIRGTRGNDLLDGGAGNDVLQASGGFDTLLGGAGNDVFLATDGAFYGGAGLDRLTLYQGAASLAIVLDMKGGGGGRDIGSGVILDGVEQINLTATAFADSLKLGARGDTVYGGDGMDSIMGRDGDDLIQSDTGNDLVLGGDGSDRLFGGAGNDKLLGEDGADLLIGQSGRDVLTGGGAADRFVFDAPVDSATGAQRDVISDFEQGLDLIDLTLMDTDDVAGDQDFRFVGQTLFRGIDMELGFFQTATDTLVVGVISPHTFTGVDLRFEIRLAGLFTLTAADFIL